MACGSAANQPLHSFIYYHFMKDLIWLINKIIVLVVLALVIWGWGWVLVDLAEHHRDEESIMGFWGVVGFCLALTFLKALLTSPGQSIDD